MAVIIQIRRDTEYSWTNINPILAQGELGENLDNGLFKIGDGINHWTTLNYYGTTTTSGLINHNLLSNLLNDDHPQYLNEYRGDLRYYTQDQEQDYRSNFLYTKSQIDTISGSLNTKIAATAQIFGSQYNIVSVEYSSTTSITPVKIATLNLNNIPQGRYHITWSYEWNRTTTNSDYVCNMKINDTTEIMGQIARVNTNYSWRPISGFESIELAAGNHFLDFYHWGESIQGTSNTRRLDIAAWRII